jgi:heterodisulfide reductase subunit B
MNIVYYPGCTMKSWAASETQAVLEVLAQVGFEVTEMARWPCCGSAEPLVEENLIKMAAPFRILSQAAAISPTLFTICPICHRVLRTVLQTIRRDPAKRAKLEDFCEMSAPGAFEVVHWMELITRQEPLRVLASSRKMPKGWLRAMPYPGCALLRPSEVLSPDNSQLLETVLKALEIDVSLNPRRVECCGGHQGIVDPSGVQHASGRILEAAKADKCSAVVTPCPLCRYNLDKLNGEGTFIRTVVSASLVAALALGVPPERFLHPADSLSRKEWEELQACIDVSQRGE